MEISLLPINRILYSYILYIINYVHRKRFNTDLKKTLQNNLYAKKHNINFHINDFPD